MRMKVNSNKVICTDFSRNVLDDFIDGHDDLSLVYPDMDLPPYQLQELHCSRIVLIRLEFIICLIESTCPSLLLPNLDPVIRNFFEALSDIGVILERIISEEGPPLWEVINHLQIIWRYISVELYK